jgi:hypothetical protein
VLADRLKGLWGQGNGLYRHLRGVIEVAISQSNTAHLTDQREHGR